MSTFLQKVEFKLFSICGIQPIVKSKQKVAGLHLTLYSVVFIYRVSDMDGITFKELFWLHFLVPGNFPRHFYGGKLPETKKRSLNSSLKVITSISDTLYHIVRDINNKNISM